MPFTLANNQSISIQALFNPLTLGNKSANIIINHDMENSPIVIALSGMGILPPILSITPTEHYFGNVIVGGTSNPQSFVIRNNGESDLIVDDIDLNGDDSIHFILNNQNTLPFVIRADETKDFTVIFRPTTLDNKSVVISIIHNASDSPYESQPLTGTGTPPRPARVTLSSPGNGLTNVPIRPLLSWNQPSGIVDGYRIYRALTSNPASNEENLIHTIESGDIIEWVHTSDLEFNTTYHWQVAAFNISGNGDASASWSFTTQIAAPNPVTLVEPGINSENVSITPQFIWQADTGGGLPTQYRLEVSKNQNLSNPVVVREINHPTTAFTITTPPLEFNTRYFWKVIAINETGESIDNTLGDFTTLMDHPDPVTLINPGVNSENVPVTPEFIWETSSGGGVPTQYRLVVSLTQDFTDIIINEIIYHPTTYFSVISPSLSHNTTCIPDQFHNYAFRLILNVNFLHLKPYIITYHKIYL